MSILLRQSSFGTTKTQEADTHSSDDPPIPSWFLPVRPSDVPDSSKDTDIDNSYQPAKDSWAEDNLSCVAVERRAFVLRTLTLGFTTRSLGVPFRCVAFQPEESE